MTLVHAPMNLDAIDRPCACIELYQLEMGAALRFLLSRMTVSPYTIAPVAKASSTSLWNRGVTRFSSSETRLP